jgi:prophage DNA circulation protein
MVAPAQVIHGLPLFSFRNLEWPHIESAPVHFSHSQAERRYPYIDAAGHDNAGRDPLKIRVRMFFLETLEAGAFTKKWPVWRKALFDGSSGPMKHPVLGPLRARVEEGDVQFVAQTTAGITVDVSFTETVDDIDKPTKFKEPYPGGLQVAKAAFQAAGIYNIPWPSQALDTDLLSAFKAITTGIWSAQTTLTGYANQVAGSLEQMISAAEGLTDPRSYVLYDNLVHLWELASDAANKASKDLRSTGSKFTQADTTLADFAAEVGNTEAEVIQLNLHLLRSPIVEKGTAITYYTGK